MWTRSSGPATRLARRRIGTTFAVSDAFIAVVGRKQVCADA